MHARGTDDSIISSSDNGNAQAWERGEKALKPPKCWWESIECFAGIEWWAEPSVARHGKDVYLAHADNGDVMLPLCKRCVSPSHWTSAGIRTIIWARAHQGLSSTLESPFKYSRVLSIHHNDWEENVRYLTSRAASLLFCSDLKIHLFWHSLNPARSLWILNHRSACLQAVHSGPGFLSLGFFFLGGGGGGWGLEVYCL